jgi:hypothetical protein
MTAGGAPQGADDNLMELLRRTLAEVDAVPDDVVAAAKQVWTWRTIDAELAELAHDSLLDDAVAGGRGTATLRALSFTAGSLFIEVEVSEDGDRRGLIGQVVPAPDPRGRPIVVVQGVGDPALAQRPIDELGRFDATGLGQGFVRLRFEFGPGGGVLVTEWVRI